MLRRLPAAIAARGAGWRLRLPAAVTSAGPAACRLLISRSCARNASSTAARRQFTLSSAVRPSAGSAALSPPALLGRQGDEYVLSPEAIADFHKLGYIHVKGVLTEAELRDIESVYMRFMRREIPVPGKDLCDMSGDFDRPFEDFSIINAMLPRVYFPPLRGNLYERRAASITRQLFNDTGFDIDYDQLLAKKPTKVTSQHTRAVPSAAAAEPSAHPCLPCLSRAAAVLVAQDTATFPWHSDMAYWPSTPDQRTATFSLALDATTRANGCLRFVDGSHLEPRIRPHRPVNQDRSKAHAIVCEVNERTADNPQGELVTYCEVARGDVTIHNERVVHGSGGNYTQGWRRTYVIAFRHRRTIEIEREAGFSHSHNDEVNWDSFNKWQDKK